MTQKGYMNNDEERNHFCFQLVNYAI